MEPVTLLLLYGGAMLLAKGKKKGQKTPPLPPQPSECPVGFHWDENERSCTPSEDGPPQISVGGMCEVWTILPNESAWFGGYALPALVEIVEAIGAQPQPNAEDQTALYGAEENLSAVVVAHLLVANSPVAYATNEISSVGTLCKLPLSEELGPDADPGGSVPEAMTQLADYVQSYVEQAIAYFNQSGQLQFPEISG